VIGAAEPRDQLWHSLLHLTVNQQTPVGCVIISYKKIVSDFLTLHAIIMALLESEAHIDSVNAASQTPLSASATGEIILKSQSEMSLKCLAAQSIRKYNLSYQVYPVMLLQVPKSLESFISGVDLGTW